MIRISSNFLFEIQKALEQVREIEPTKYTISANTVQKIVERDELRHLLYIENVSSNDLEIGAKSDNTPIPLKSGEIRIFGNHWAMIKVMNATRYVIHSDYPFELWVNNPNTSDSDIVVYALW